MTQPRQYRTSKPVYVADAMPDQALVIPPETLQLELTNARDAWTEPGWEEIWPSFIAVVGLVPAVDRAFGFVSDKTPTDADLVVGLFFVGIIAVLTFNCVRMGWRAYKKEASPSPRDIVQNLIRVYSKTVEGES